VPKIDLPGQRRFLGTAPGAVRECTVDDDGWHAADAVTTGRRYDGGIVHVADFDIVLGARQELDEFHSLGSSRAPGCKDLDFSALRHVETRARCIRGGLQLAGNRKG
jgi:hypothetical protein